MQMNYSEQHDASIHSQYFMLPSRERRRKYFHVTHFRENICSGDFPIYIERRGVRFYMLVSKV